MLHFPERRKTDSVKWDLFEEDVLPLWVADMDFTSPPAVIEALQQRAAHGVFGYSLDSIALKKLLVERMADLYHWQITEEDILLLPGVVSGFNLSCQAVVQPGDSLLIQPPVYPPFFSAAANAQARSVFHHLLPSPDGTYQVDIETFKAAIEPDTRGFLLCNPHNPIGRVFTRDELLSMAQTCLHKGVTIISDEIHCDLIFKGYKHIPIASLNKEIEANTITLLAPSKTFNIAGLDCSIMICTNETLRSRVRAAKRGLMGGVNLLGMTAALAAYRDGSQWLADVMTYLEANCDFLMGYLKQYLPQIHMIKPEATYLAWLDCNLLQLGVSPSEYFHKNARVALNNGKDFGESGAGYVRMNFGCSRETLELALERIKRSLQ